MDAITAIRDTEEQRKFESLESPAWVDLWSGYFDFGWAVARGNARTNTLTNAFEAIRATRTDKTRLYFRQIYANATIDDLASATANAIRGGWAYNHDITGRVFFNLFNDYEYDRFQNLDLRFVAGGGLGAHVIESERLVFDLVGGASYNRENFFNGLSRNSAEAYWGDELRYQLNSSTTLSQTFRMFNNLSEGGEYRMNFDLSAATALRRWLSLQVTASDRFLSNPVFGRQRNDVLLTTGVRFTFAR